MKGLHGVPVNEAKYFDDESDLISSFKTHSASKQNVLYIPKAWNYPRIDAVLVSHHSKSSSKAAKAASTPALSASPSTLVAESSSSSSAISSSASAQSSPDSALSAASYVHIEFIQISVGAITSDKLTKTRSVLNSGSSELSLWRQVAESSSVDLKFSLRWLIASAQVANVQNSAGFNKMAENVSPLSSVNAALTL